MIALAYLLNKSTDWSNAQVVLKSIITKEDERESAQSKLSAFLEQSRLGIIGEIIIGKNKNLFETIRESSKDVDLVFLGIRPPAEDESVEDYAKYYEELLDKTQDFPMLVKTLASEDIDFQRIFKS